MTISQIENLYKANGLYDFKLKTTDNLLKVHGVDFTEVDGYKKLDDINRKLYEKFIINLFNAFGLESRATLVPKGIYYVENIDYLAKEKDDDCFIVVGGIVYSIDRNGMKSVLHSWKDEDYEHLDISEKEIEKYLRFEYKIQGKNEWLHVTNEKSWY